MGRMPLRSTPRKKGHPRGSGRKRGGPRSLPEESDPPPARRDGPGRVRWRRPLHTFHRVRWFCRSRYAVNSLNQEHAKEARRAKDERRQKRNELLLGKEA